MTKHFLTLNCNILVSAFLIYINTQQFELERFLFLPEYYNNLSLWIKLFVDKTKLFHIFLKKQRHQTTIYIFEQGRLLEH